MTIVGYVPTPKHLALVMEFAPFGSYNALLKAHTASLAFRCLVVRDVARALDHLHANGVLHRDVKSGNVLITADPAASSDIDRPVVAKLCDFEFCIEENRALHDDRIGTPIYCSPELWNHQSLTYKSDVFSSAPPP